ncbi:glycosyltransferase family 2 protein [Paenibacillus alginolyticus]|uniref:glycosyltransferase family 2 protein n=1 Tax=Paenibacillus alginolyticus TaxID=59839 RepID=UPI0003FD7C70|nr:glycosyltransferase family 2 protein [Paenibacillus alginolyticus]MCY9668244.1 glycosyltransferase family 2 protein [Paenibacillus alginolyticus]
MQVSIVIPTFNGLPLLKECVASIRSHTSVPFEIIVVDNGSQDGTLEYCYRERLKLVSIPVNRGFPAACNFGLRIATGNALMLLNNDTIVTPNWLDNLMRCLYSSEDIGMVGPVTNYASGKQQIQEPFTNIADMAAKYNNVDTSLWQETERLVGICLLFKREMLDKVGLMDERFSPGHFEDDDLCYRARLAGYRLLITGDCFIFHHGSASFSKKSQEAVQGLLQQNRQKFIDKWGVDPHSFI